MEHPASQGLVAEVAEPSFDQVEPGEPYGDGAIDALDARLHPRVVGAGGQPAAGAQEGVRGFVAIFEKRHHPCACLLALAKSSRTLMPITAIGCELAPFM